MFWRLFHKLFGWDYVLQPHDCCICQICVDVNTGKPYYKHYGYMLFEKEWEFIWLTCKPEKYIKKPKKDGIYGGESCQ